jgi:DNA-binding transcriptional regulator YhcF (GntR family)
MGQSPKRISQKQLTSIIALASEGRSGTEIASAIGANANTVQNVIGKLRGKGEIPPRKRAKSGVSKDASYKFETSLGDFISDFAELPREVQDWMEAQCSENMTMTQLALMCVKDAYCEEIRAKFAPSRKVAA